MLFDPSAVNKQIDAMLAVVPPGKRLTMLASANLQSKSLSASLSLKITDSVGAYVRVTKTVGGGLDADGGVKISFLVDDPEAQAFTYPELVAVFKDRGLGWMRSHYLAYKLLHSGEIAL